MCMYVAVPAHERVSGCVLWVITNVCVYMGVYVRVFQVGVDGCF